jgi:hypothetical protein
LLSQPIVDAVKRGAAVFDGRLMSECLSQGFRMDCVTNVSDPPACAHAVQGRVAEGGACISGAECIGHGSCHKPQGCDDLFCCEGTCGPPLVGLGGDCSRDSLVCQSGTYCEGGVCVADLPAGESCTLGRKCAVPAVCSYPVAGGPSAVCTVPAASGGACDPTRTEVCARSDEYCDTATRVCTKRHPPGEACSAEGDCLDYAFCRNGACVAPGVGAACNSATGDLCMDGLTCQGGVCTKHTYAACGA